MAISKVAVGFGDCHTTQAHWFAMTVEVGSPYNNFTNYAVSICKQTEIILPKRKTPLRNTEELLLQFLCFSLQICIEFRGDFTF